MIETITIRESTKALIEKLRQSDNDPVLLKWETTSAGSTVSFSIVLAWLEDRSLTAEKSNFHRDRLRVALLEDLYAELLVRQAQKPAPLIEEKTYWYEHATFILLATAGTMLALCDGFDGVTSILSLFVGIPMWAVFLAGSAFSLLSLTVFYGFDLMQISQNLNVGMSQARQAIDVFVEQVAVIKNLRKIIKSLYDEQEAQAELCELQQILAMLDYRYQCLDNVRKMYTNELNQPYLQGLKIGVALIAGLLFFSYGFFSGQSLAVAIFSLFVTSVSLTFWPVLVISIIMGLAAFGVFWFVERPGLENLVGSWLGFDQEKIELLANEDTVAEQKEKFTELKSKIDTKLSKLNSCMWTQKKATSEMATQTDAALQVDDLGGVGCMTSL